MPTESLHPTRPNFYNLVLTATNDFIKISEIGFQVLLTLRMKRHGSNPILVILNNYISLNTALPNPALSATVKEDKDKDNEDIHPLFPVNL